MSEDACRPVGCQSAGKACALIDTSGFAVADDIGSAVAQVTLARWAGVLVNPLNPGRDN
jgi:hypothetical protein